MPPHTLALKQIDPFKFIGSYQPHSLVNASTQFDQSNFTNFTVQTRCHVHLANDMPPRYTCILEHIFAHYWALLSAPARINSVCHIANRKLLATV